nr:MAG TPA: hypothetical protein [Caudoviricetes sp.]
MLVKDETKYCWVDGEIAGEPQDSIKDAIADYLEYYSNLWDVGDSDHSYLGECSDIEWVRVGHPFKDDMKNQIKFNKLNIKGINRYNMRSHIPLELVKDILKRCEQYVER